MRVLLTGATGFVGHALTAELSLRGHQAIAVGGPTSVDVEHSADVSDEDQVKSLEAIGPVNAVVHAAGIAHRFGKVTDDEFHRVNVVGVENVAKLAVSLGSTHFLLFSSTLVYGKRRDAEPVREDDECQPFDAYGHSKLEGESAARRVCEGAGMALTIFRPAPIMGEGSKGNFGKLIRAIDSGKFIWVGPGENLKSVVYVGDVAKAAGEALSKDLSGTEVYNIAADPVKMKDIVKAIATALKRQEPSFHLPAAPVRFAAHSAAVFGGKLARYSAMLDTWLGDDVYSNEKLQRACRFKPSTPLATAIEREVEYYLKHK